KAKVAMGKMTAAQRDFNKAVKELREGQYEYEDVIGKMTEESLRVVLKNAVIRRAELQKEVEEAKKTVQGFSILNPTNAYMNQFGGDVNRQGGVDARANLKRLIEEQKKYDNI